MRKGPEKTQRRFGIGEIYGHSFATLSKNTRSSFVDAQSVAGKRTHPCPFIHLESAKENCTKRGGVCSFRLYERDEHADHVVPVTSEQGRLRTLCPRRFDEDGLIYKWIGEVLLGDSDPIILNEVGFLEKLPSATDDNNSRNDDAGKIDNVLVVANAEGDVLRWCAIEKQAVYFSGQALGKEWSGIRNCPDGQIPFPAQIRRPDYRSSGPKRLMPQLQTKVPTLRRWGKKMAVVIDEDFFAALGPMDRVEHVSNSDIAWFVVGFDEIGDRFQLVRREVHLTTLERAVEGLTAGRPVSLELFEARMQEKLKKRK